LNFHSPEYIILLVTLSFLYYKVPIPARSSLLLGASALFYMWWRPEYVVIILLSVTIDYFVALGFDRSAGPASRKGLLVVSVTTNLGILFFFKYYDFVANSLNALLGVAHSPWHAPILDLILPLGISFHTFQALSYTIDVYRGERVPERRIHRLWLYVLFFPQLVAGPIEPLASSRNSTSHTSSTMRRSSEGFVGFYGDF
jgi:D-alanyl-lipoteichoic acid acyltransferase DltB (MBOAT superfamily)